MKKFWNQHRTGIVIGVISAVVLTVVIHVILILCGFHFLYSPEQYNNWDAVSGVAAWAGIFVSSFLSVMAIWYAIQVPKKIADRQDKIALFEKRHGVYCVLSQCLTYASQLDFFMEKSEERYWIFLLALERQEQFKAQATYYDVANILYDTSAVLRQSEFLFSKEVSAEIEKLCGQLFILLDPHIADAASVLEQKNKYIQIADHVQKQCIPAMQIELMIK